MARHLASAAGRLVSVRLGGAERERLNQLLHSRGDAGGNADANPDASGPEGDL